jgi:dTDP-4-amino-4,6-dideoxygalactose transaminase
MVHYNKTKWLGTLGDLAVFSFYPTKNLGCYGDGGIIVTDSEEIFRKAVMLRSYGQEAKHIHVIEGFNSRLDEVQAAILEVKLKYLDSWNKKRRHLAWLYGGAFGCPVTLPLISHGHTMCTTNLS